MASPKRDDLTEIQRKALDAIVSYHISHGAGGTPVGHVVLQGPPQKARDYEAAATWLVRSGFVEATGIAPGQTLHPLWLGLMLSSVARAVEDVADRLLIFFKGRINMEGIDFKKYSLDQVVAERVIDSRERIFFLHAIVTAFSLASDSSVSAGPPPDATWYVPRDIVSFRGFSGMRDLQIRIQLPPIARHVATFHQAPKDDPMPTVKNPRDVFVVHGRDEAIRHGMFSFLRALGLNPMEFEEVRSRTNKTSPYIGEILNVAFKEAQAVVVILSGDDEALLRASLRKPSEPRYETELTPQARPNVLFEAGMAIGRDEAHTILVEVGNNLRPLSDIAGRHTVRMTSGLPDERSKIADRLRTAGCAVETEGKTDWLMLPYFEKVFGP